ncbi:MAG TPA: hypothetical protein PKD84_10250 [Propionicimonas sp.]|nr:hypothetical protein [Propionicimonas sp.]
MNSKQRIGLAIGGGVLAVGAAVGVGAMAANLAGSDTTTQGTSGYGQGPGGGMGQNRQLDTTEMATALAEKLGVDESAVKTALDNAMQASRPSDGNGTPPSGAPSGAPTGAAPSGGPNTGGGGRNTEMLTAMASAIATELNLDQSTVLTALQEVWAEYGPGANQPSSQPTS